MAARAGTAYVGIEADFSKLNRQVSAKMGQLGKQGNALGSKLGHGIGSGIGVGAKVAAVGLGALTAEVVRATKGWADHQAIVRRSQAVIKSTGAAAGVTAKHVGNLSDAIERQTGVDGDLVQSGANLLLTFTNVRNGVGKNNKIFDEATKTTVNMSKALGQDTKASAIQLGKALNDPVKGVTALSKVGVSFTDQQKKQIKTLVDSGKTMEAQKIILKELGKEFPKVKATPFERLQVVLRGVEDTIGKAVLPIFNKFVSTVTPKLQHVANVVSDVFGDKNLNWSEKLKTIGASIGHWFGPVVSNIVNAIKDAHIDDKLQAAIEVAEPKVLAAFKTIGGRAAGVLLKAFMDAPAWAKVLTVTALAGKLGVFSALGKVAATKFAEAMGPKVAASFAAEGLIGSKVDVVMKAAGTRWGKLAGAGLIIGLLLAFPQAVTTISDFIKEKVPAAAAFSGKEGWRNLGIVLGEALVNGLSTAATAGLNVAKNLIVGAFNSIISGVNAKIGLINKFSPVNIPKIPEIKIPDIKAPKVDFGTVTTELDRTKRKVDDTFASMAKNTSGHLRDIRTAVTSNTTIIKNRLGSDTAAGKAAMAQNFRAAAAAVKRSMDDGVISTTTGTAEIRRLMVKALTSMGLSKEQAQAKLDTGTVQTDRGPGAGAGKRGAQTGRYIHGSGEGDKYPIVAEAGEYVLNKKAVKKVGKQTLDRLNFRDAPRFQSGGAVGGLQPAIASLSSQLEKMFGLSLSSGFRTNMPLGHPDYHNSGLAADISGPEANMARAVKFIMSGGIWKKLLEGIHNPGLSIKNGAQVPPGFWGATTWAAHANHIHLALQGAIGALLGGGAPKIIPAVFGGSGFAQAIAQRASTLTASAGNTTLKAVAASLGGGDVTDMTLSGVGGGARAIITAGLKLAGLIPNSANVQSMLTLLSKENRSGSATAVNPIPVGRAHEHATGFLQMLPSTFRQYAVAGHNNILNPVDNAAASALYQLARYHGLTTQSPYKLGGLVGKARSGFQKGGGVFAAAAKKVAKPKPGHKPANQRVKDRIAKHLANIGFKKDQDNLNALAATVATDDDFASRLSGIADTEAIQDALNDELTRRGGTSAMTEAQIAGLFPAEQQDALIQSLLPRLQGMTQVDWLNKELGDLLGERNILIDEPGVLDKIKAQVEKQLKELKAVIKTVAKHVIELVKHRTKIVELQGKKHDALVAAKAELKAEQKKKKPDKKRVARLQAHVDKYKREESALQSGGRPELQGDEGQEIDSQLGFEFHHSQAWYNDRLTQLRPNNQARQDTVDQLTSGTDDNLVSLPNIASALSSVTDSLGTIQGLGSPMTKFGSSSEFTIGALGGTILSVQESIRDLVTKPARAEATAAGADATAAGDSSKELLAQLLREANLRTSVSEAQFAVFKELGLPTFGGSFASGGVVPGPYGEPRMILAHGGEVVTPIDKIEPSNSGGGLYFSADAKKLFELFDVRIDQRTRTQSRRGERMLPGRAGNLG